jgi:STE24 endopeptidase
MSVGGCVEVTDRDRSAGVFVVLVAVAGLALAACSSARGSADAFDPRPGTVLVDDSPGESDEVRFYFSAGARDVEAFVAATARSAGIPNRGIELTEEDDDASLVLELRTTMGRRSGFLERQIDGDVLAALDAFQDGRLMVELHAEAVVEEGDLRLVEDDFTGSTFAVNASSDVTYRFPSSYLLRSAAVVLGLVLVPLLLGRVAVRRIEGAPVDEVEKVHRLRRAVLIAAVALGLGLGPAMLFAGLFSLPDLLLSEIASSVTRSRSVTIAIGALSLLLIFSVAVVPVLLVVSRSYRRVRHIDMSPKERRRKSVRALALVVPLILWVVVRAYLVGSDGSEAVRVAGSILLLVAFVLLVPYTLLIAADTTRLPSDLRARLLELCRAQGLRVRDVRLMQSRSQKVANAFFLGLIPWFRYIVISDYLVDQLDEDELHAVVAHEIAHGKRHHLLLRLIAGLVIAAVLTGGLIGILLLLRDLSPLWVLVAVPLILPVAILGAHGIISIRLEQKADDFAADVVGLDPTIRALEKLADLNMMKRRTGRIWNVLTQHPAVQQRVDRLQARAAGDNTSSRAAGA